MPDVPAGGTWSILTRAVARVPGGRWVFGPIAIAAAAATILGLFASPQLALFGGVLTFAFVLLFYAFAREAAKPQPIRGPLIVLVWVVTGLFSVVLITLYSCVFFGWPVDKRDWLSTTPVVPVQPPPPGQDIDEKTGENAASATAPEAEHQPLGESSEPPPPQDDSLLPPEPKPPVEEKGGGGPDPPKPPKPCDEAVRKPLQQALKGWIPNHLSLTGEVAFVFDLKKKTCTRGGATDEAICKALARHPPQNWNSLRGRDDCVVPVTVRFL